MYEKNVVSASTSVKTPPESLLEKKLGKRNVKTKYWHTGHECLRDIQKQKTRA